MVRKRNICVEIIDNFLTPPEFASLQKLMTGDMFPWYYNAYKVESDVRLHAFQFTHTFLLNGRSDSSYMAIPNLLVAQLGFGNLVRAKANLTTPTPLPFEYGMHIDIAGFEGTTALYYVCDSNGPTIFDGGGSVECKANRMVFFPSHLRHSAVSATDAKARIVVNLNLEVQ